VYAFGTISGGHFNPAVTLGAALARRVEWKALPAYWIVQVIGGLAGGLVVYVVAKGNPGFTAKGNMAANGFGQHSPGDYSLWAVLITEVILTGIFLLVILGCHRRSGTQRIRRAGHRTRPDADPPDLNTHLQHLSEPCALHWCRLLQR